MRYEGDAVKYSAFALVAIESVWPNPEGNELSPDEEDMAALGKTAEPFKSRVRNGFKPSSEVITEEDYHSKQGYYKILPLNVIDLSTTTSVDSGSSFSVTFTLDDLLLVVPSENNLDAFRYATGLPISANDLISSDNSRDLPQLLSPDGSNEGSWRYVKDAELGLSRYRVTGPYSSFNVEDLVDVNDTVTIWIYHDPSDFYLKDGQPSFDGDGLLQGSSNEIANIIGSGDRQNQFSTDQRDFDETFLSNIGLVNKTIIEAISLEEGDRLSQIRIVDRSNLGDIIRVMSQEAAAGILGDNARRKIEDYVATGFPNLERGSIQYNYIVDIFSTIRRVDARPRQEGEELPRIDFNSRINAINRIIDNLEENSFGMLVLPGEETENYASIIESMQELGLDDPEDLVVSLGILKNSLNSKAVSYASNYLNRRASKTARQVFSNGRTVAINKAHGETPYLALKGVISSVQSSIGTAEGSYVVTISGKGYEKVLTDNQIFYEDLLYPESDYSPLTDYNTVYMNMSPSRAVQQIIARWAPRQIAFGQLTSYSTLAFNRMLSVRGALSAETDSEGILKKRGFPGANGEFLLRGMFVYSNYVNSAETENPEFLRVFSPINYLDATRVREMTVTLDRSYRNPATEANFNAVQSVAGRESIMSNLRRVGGVANFYEMFVDETGRFRYRLRFEALERTPDTGITPIIQDYDVMASGTAFGTDDSQLKTMVDVIPIGASQSTNITGLPFIGRSVPPGGGVPIEGIDAVVNEVSLAPEFFKYGLRAEKVEDLYQSEPYGARRKAHLYRMFYEKPLKRAQVRVKNNTSYRAGETVLVSLQKNKRRSRTLIDLPRMIEWLDYLLDNPDIMEMYIGVEKRFLPAGKNSYYFTSGEYTPIPNADIYNKEFVTNPTKFVAEAIRDTLVFMLGATTPTTNVLTPEYFPTTYWYYRTSPGGFTNWDQGKGNADEDIKELYRRLINMSVTGGTAGDRARVAQLLTRPDASNRQGLINGIKFQNFRATSYYIESVSHKLTYGTEASTVLSLNYGQDNLVLLEPISFLPIGFISLERKMRIGYRDEYQNNLWQEPFLERSAMQNMYLYQFEEDSNFKKASFLYQSQYLRNSSNYMYEIANFYNPMDVGGIVFDRVEEESTLETNRVASREVPVSEIERARNYPEGFVEFRDAYLRYIYDNNPEDVARVASAAVVKYDRFDELSRDVTVSGLITAVNRDVVELLNFESDNQNKTYNREENPRNVTGNIFFTNSEEAVRKAIGL